MDTQARKDALADAETLLLVADELRDHAWFGQRSLWSAVALGDCSRGACQSASSTRRYGRTGAYYHGTAHKLAREAARAALRAVPGLREE